VGGEGCKSSANGERAGACTRRAASAVDWSLADVEQGRVRRMQLGCDDNAVAAEAHEMQVLGCAKET
jgi:hypothetical protein